MKTNKSFLRRIFSLNTLFFLAILGLAYNMYLLSIDVKPIKDKGEGIIDELNSSSVRGQMFADDLNEIRQYLLLPTKDYSSGELTDDGDQNLESAILSFIGSVGQDAHKTEQVQSLNNAVSGLVNSESFKNLLSKKALSVEMLNPEYDGSQTYDLLVFSNANYDDLALLKGNILDGTYLLYSSTSVDQIGKDLDPRLFDLIENGKDAWVDARKVLDGKKLLLGALGEDKELTEIFKEKGLVFDNSLRVSDETYSYDILMGSSPVLTLGVLKMGGQFFIDYDDKRDLVYDSDKFKDALLNKLNSVDLRNPVVVLVEERKNKLEETFQQESFKAFLQEFGGELTAPKEEADRFVYELRRGDELVGSIILEKGTGLVKVLKAGQEFAMNVFDYSPETQKKN